MTFTSRTCATLVGAALAFAPMTLPAQEVVLSLGSAGVENFDPANFAASASAELPVASAWRVFASGFWWAGQDANLGGGLSMTGRAYGNAGYLAGLRRTLLGAERASLALGLAAGAFERLNVREGVQQSSVFQPGVMFPCP